MIQLEGARTDSTCMLMWAAVDPVEVPSIPLMSWPACEVIMSIYNLRLVEFERDQIADSQDLDEHLT